MCLRRGLDMIPPEELTRDFAAAASIFFIASGVPLKYTLISMESVFSNLPEYFSRVRFSDKKSTRSAEKSSIDT